MRNWGYEFRETFSRCKFVLWGIDGWYNRCFCGNNCLTLEKRSTTCSFCLKRFSMHMHWSKLKQTNTRDFLCWSENVTWGFLQVFEETERYFSETWWLFEKSVTFCFLRFPCENQNWWSKKTIGKFNITYVLVYVELNEMNRFVSSGLKFERKLIESFFNNLFHFLGLSRLSFIDPIWV